MDTFGTKKTSSKVGTKNPVGSQDMNCPKGFGKKAGSVKGSFTGKTI